jgi:glycosyltransferase involved in cell wall biosynthesis
LKKSTKNILLVHSSNDLYGASKILITIIEILIKSGHSVHLILPEDGPLNNHKSLKNVHLSIINLAVFRKKYFNFLGLINRFVFIIKSTFQIKKIINKHDIDLVYTNTSTIVSPTFAAQLTKTPSIFHVHEIPYGSNLYTKFLTKIFNLFSEKIIAVSNSTRDYWLKKGVVHNKITVIKNGFNFEFSSTNNTFGDKVIFTNVSRIIPYKGHLFLIELFNEILKERKDLILQIVGDTLPYYNDYLIELKSKVKEYKIENSIIFLGYKDDIKSILNKSQFFIHTPISPDPFPTVIFEAIESCTPVISTDNGGVREILNDFNNGLLIEINDIKKSAQLILNYIINKDLQKKNIDNSIKFVSNNFKKQAFSKKLISLISNFE